MDSHRKYTEQEKQHLLANLELEVAHKTRQFEAWLADSLQNFRIHQEGQISRIPKLVRGITLREFQKYHGDVQVALRGLQKQKLEKLGAMVDGSMGETDKSMRKRKWLASQDAEGESSGSGSGHVTLETERAAKSARIMEATPKKKPGSSTGPGTAQRARLLAAANKTPGTSRTMGRIPPTAPSSPPKSRHPSSLPRPPSRPTSPSKLSAPKHNTSQPTRPPSSAGFNPTLPPKTPVYPNARLPRRNESMLSLNGSPLTNPYDLGIRWFKSGSTAEANGGMDDADDVGHGNGKGKGKMTDMVNGELKENMAKKSNTIIVRREPSSFALGGFHSRTNSTTSLYASSQSGTAQSSSQTQSYDSPSSLDATPKPQSQFHKAHASADSLAIASAMVAIPTSDGHFLEFDPLLTSPGSLDALVGITDSAKKQAREEMGRLIQAAVDKWKLT